MAFLYTNPQGKNISWHSYSAGQTFSYCKRKYQLEKIQGWKQKEKNAAMDFGNCVEAAIQHFYTAKKTPGSAVAEFKRRWLEFKDNKELVYSGKNTDWETVNTMGTQMLQLFEIREPVLGLNNPKFQKSYKKEVFPGTMLSGIFFTAYADLLNRMDEKEWEILDIKVSGTSFNDTPNIATLDPQLRSYGWISGIKNSGFLYFTSAGLEVKSGDEVSLLEDSGVFKAGDKLVTMSTGETSLALLHPNVYVSFEKETEGKTTKEVKAIKAAWLPTATVVKKSTVTKQKLDLIRVSFTDEDLKDTGEAIGLEIAEIHFAREKNSYPKEPGVRFPGNKCTLCAMLPICLKDDKRRDDTLVQIGTKIGDTDEVFD